MNLRRSGPGLVFATALLAVLSGAAHAGPWTKSQGELYLKFSEGIFLSGEYVDARASRQVSGGPDTNADHKSATTALYTEIGVFDRLHFQLYVPHVLGRNAYGGGASYVSAGGGDLIAGLQWSPLEIAFPHAVRADLKVPLYDVAEPKGFERARFPSRGDGQLDATVWLSLGDTIAPLPVYAFGEIGHRFRTEQYVGEGESFRFRDSLVFNGQVGYTSPWSIVLAGNAAGVIPYRTDDVTKGYVNLGASLFAPILSGFAVEASFDGAVWARNSSRGLSLALGVSYHR